MKSNRTCVDCNKSITSGSVLGRCKSCSRKYQYATRPETHPMIGKLGELSANYIDGRAITEHLCVDCGKKIAYITYHKNNGRRCCSCESKRKHREKIINNNHRGSNNPNWQGGLNEEGYSFEFNAELKEQIRKRDDYTCQKCGMTEEEHLIVYGRILHVHHIDYNKDNCKKENLLTLCLACNVRANYNRDYWKDYYQKKVSDICSNV